MTYVKRFHDLGLSGWWAIFVSFYFILELSRKVTMSANPLLIFDPNFAYLDQIIRIIVGVLSLILLFKRGTKGVNKYGEDPLVKRIMTKCIESTLIVDEKIVLSPEIHPIVYLKPVIRLGIYLLIGIIILLIEKNLIVWTAVGFLLFVFGVFEVCCLIYNYLYYPRVEMAVTNKRVVCKTGIIGVDSEELQWNRIESIEIRQSVLGRLLNYGDVNFSGTGVSFVRFDTVKNPRMVKAKAAEILSK